MPLTTRCTHCGHLFPIYAQELKRRRGRIHCPQCARRFDGLSALIEEPMLRQEPSAVRARFGLGSVDVSKPGPSTRTLRDRLGLARRSIDGIPPSAGAHTQSSVASLDNPLASLPLGRAAPLGAGSQRRGTGGFGRRLGGRWLGRRPGWGVAALALLLAVPLQIAWWKRADLLRDPTTRTRLSALCEPLGCELPVPRLSGALAVLEPTLTPRPESGALVLKLAVRNGAPVAQPAPLLELELLDPQGELAAVRRFKLAEYGLFETARGTKGLLAPGETLRVMLELRKPNLETSGFKVRLL